jgi:PilZ domain
MTDRSGKSAPSPKKEDSDSDKRYSLRLRKYIDVVVEDPLSAMLFRGAVADISPTGMRVIADQYLPVGSKYTFTMKRNPFLRLRGQVRWIRAFTGDTYQVGVLIVEATEDDRKRLTNFLELERQRLTSG